jgi:Flp pilus assembly pilin Flp
MRNFLKCNRGAVAAEYALIIAVIGVAVAGSSLALAGAISDSITMIAAKINA